jgi:hypothetical protein
MIRTAMIAAALNAALAMSAAAQAPNATPPAAPNSAPAPNAPAPNTPAPGAASAFRCPDSIQVAEQATAPPGFAAEAGSSEHRFLQVAFFDGPHSDRSGSLAPDNDTKRGRLSVQTFSFAAPPRARPVYAVCRYRDTAAVLVVDVPDTISRCTLTFTYNQRTGAVGTPRRPQRMQCQ